MPSLQEEGHTHHYHIDHGVRQLLVGANDCKNHKHGVLTDGPDHACDWCPKNRVCMNEAPATTNATAHIREGKAKIGEITVE